MPNLRANLKAGGAPFKVRWLMKKAARMAFAFFGYPFGAAVDIRITDDRGIARLNRETRQVDKPTDVLSFPMYDFQGGRPDGELAGHTGRVFLGDIVISYERALEQAKAYGHLPAREFAYLTVHSMLHLLGFDHMEDRDKLVMRALEEEIMRQMGLPRIAEEE